MKENYVILSIEKNINELSITKILTRLLKNDFKFISYENNLYIFSVVDVDKDSSILKSSFDALLIDFDCSIKGLILPYNEPKLYKWVNEIEKDEILYLFQVAYKDKQIYGITEKLLEDIPPSTLKTVMVYIESNSSPTFAGLKLYCHRNTVTYRIKSFENHTNISISSFVNKMFIYNLLDYHFSKNDSYSKELSL